MIRRLRSRQTPPTSSDRFNGSPRCFRHRLATVLAACLVFTCAVTSRAEDTAAAPAADRSSMPQRAWGTAEPGTVNLGMWTRHVDRPGVDNDVLLGGTFRGVFLGTFKNSWHDRSYVLGIERRVFRRQAGVLSFDGGYRIGLIHGYDERMIAAAGKIPVVPFIEPVANVVWKNRLGVQAGFCVKVVTLGAIVRF